MTKFWPSTFFFNQWHHSFEITSVCLCYGRNLDGLGLRGCVATSTRLQWNYKRPELRVWIVFAFLIPRKSRFWECRNFDAFTCKILTKAVWKKNHRGPNSSFLVFPIFSDRNFADESGIHSALYFLECPVHKILGMQEFPRFYLQNSHRSSLKKKS